MSSWFVRPETTTLHVDGQTLVVRKYLSMGEHRARLARLYDTTAGGLLRVNPRQVGLATVTAYLLDWSITDDDGAPIPIRGLSLDDLQRVLDDLFPDRFAAIQDVIDAHEIAMLQARADLKKTAMTGDQPSPPI